MLVLTYQSLLLEIISILRLFMNGYFGQNDYLSKNHPRVKLKVQTSLFKRVCNSPSHLTLISINISLSSVYKNPILDQCTNWGKSALKYHQHTVSSCKFLYFFVASIKQSSLQSFLWLSVCLKLLL